MKPLSIPLLVVVLVSVYLLTACESAPKAGESGQPASTATSPTQVKPPQPYTGLQAFSCVSALAQKWSPDVIPVRLESQVNSEANGQDGKSTVWKAGFISPSHGRIKYFYCSGSRLKDSPSYGPSAGSEEPYGSDVPSLGFQPLFLKTDSDKAYAVALAHGGASLIKKNPDQPVTYFVLWNTKQRALYWYVMYGKDKESSAGTGIVNALTGAFVGASK
jgi:hypothetical protein